MSCASFIHVEAPPPAPALIGRRSKADLDLDNHAALIGLQALTLNLASANRSSEPEPIPRKKCLKPLSISTARKTPEKHVSISPLSATPRSVSSSPRCRPSPSRSDSSGFHSLHSPQSSASDTSTGSTGSTGSAGSVTGSGSICWHRGRPPGDARLFTNLANVEVKHSESMESVNTRSGGGSVSGGGRQRQNSRGSRQGTPASRQGTPSSRQGTPASRQSTPQPRYQGAQQRQPRQDQGFEDYTSVFDVQQQLKKGQLVEGVLRINAKSYRDAYISAPVNLGRADGHLRWRSP